MYFCLCVLPLRLISAAVGVCCCAVLCHFFSVPLSLSFDALLCWILFSGAVEILTLCSQTPHPVTTLSSLSSTSPLIGEVQSCEHRRCIPACTTAPLTADRLLGLLSVIVASVYFPPLLSPPLLLSHRVGAATSSCNPALQKAVIELEIHAGIIAVI